MEMKWLVSLDAVANQLEEDLLRRNVSIVSPPRMEKSFLVALTTTWSHSETVPRGGGGGPPASLGIPGRK